MSLTGSANDERCPQAILDLVDRFALHRETCQRDAYNEAQVRREFIDPCFALRLDTTDRPIDELVYQLYGLTDDVVEDATNR